MKKILLATIAAGCSFAAFGQGVVNFENFNTSSTINYGQKNTAGTPAPVTATGFTVSLLWFNGTSFQTIDTLQSSSAAVGGFAGYFSGGSVTVPTFAATGTFEVAGWYNPGGNYASYAAAVAASGSYVGQTAQFTAQEVQSPAAPVAVANANKPAPAGSWTGALLLTPVPEPSTIALGGLGAAALLLFRRRK